MNANFSKIATIAIIFFAMLAACSDTEKITQEMTPRKSKPVGERHYGPIEPVVLDLPEDVSKILGGLGVDGKPVNKVFVYFRNANIVVYRDSFDLKNYIETIGQVFQIIADNEAFTKEADIWAVQMQKSGTIEFVAMAVTPAQAKSYAKSGNLKKFLAEADYLMVNDEIIEPARRVPLYESLSSPTPEPTAPPTPTPSPTPAPAPIR